MYFLRWYELREGLDPSGASLVPPPGLNFLRILASSTSMREDSSSLDLALRRSVMKLLRPRAWDDMVGGLLWLCCVCDVYMVCLRVLDRVPSRPFSHVIEVFESLIVVS